MPEERNTHISSLLLTVRPSHVDSTVGLLSDFTCLEVAHVEPGGKIIVTLETKDQFEITSVLTDIQLLEGVASAALVYHHSEKLPEEAEFISTN